MRGIADELTTKGVALSPGGSRYDPTDPVGRLMFNVLAMVAEFEGDLISMRTKEGMAVARAKGRLKGKQPKLSKAQRKLLFEIYDRGEYSQTEIAELFGVPRNCLPRAPAPPRDVPRFLRGTRLLTANAPGCGPSLRGRRSRGARSALRDRSFLQMKSETLVYPARWSARVRNAKRALRGAPVRHGDHASSCTGEWQERVAVRFRALSELLPLGRAGAARSFCSCVQVVSRPAAAVTPRGAMPAFPRGRGPPGLDAARGVEPATLPGMSRCPGPPGSPRCHHARRRVGGPRVSV